MSLQRNIWKRINNIGLLDGIMLGLISGIIVMCSGGIFLNPFSRMGAYFLIAFSLSYIFGGLKND
jgi:hypothetical protein